MQKIDPKLLILLIPLLLISCLAGAPSQAVMAKSQENQTIPSAAVELRPDFAKIAYQYLAQTAPPVEEINEETPTTSPEEKVSPFPDLNNGPGPIYATLGAGSWTYEQLFNSLSTADLNTQDSWSGNTAFDVEESVKFEGAKAVEADITGAGQNLLINRSISAIADGTFYIALRTDSITSNIAGFYLRSDTTSIVRILLISGKIEARNGGGWNIIYNSPLANTWYLFRVEFNDADHPDQFQVTVWDGAWLAPSGWFSTETGYSTINNIQLLAIEDGDSSTKNYFDTITPNDPTVIPVPEETTSLLSSFVMVLFGWIIFIFLLPWIIWKSIKFLVSLKSKL
jgi:hypothetical protein